jgi:tetratricopeptide (TPR) repeat protein
MHNQCRHVTLLIALAAVLSLRAQGQVQHLSEEQYIERSQELIRTEQLNDAERILQEGIRAHPQSGGLYNLMGIVAAQKNELAESEAAFRKAVQYSPALVPALLNLARVFHGEGKDEAAIHTYQRALRFDNHLKEAHANLAALLLDKEDYIGAERQLSFLPESVRKQNRFSALMCAAFAGLGKLDEAREAAAQMTGTVTEQDVSRAAFTLAKLHESTLVIQLLEPVAKNMSSRELRGLLATAYEMNGNLAQARANFESLAREDQKQTRPLVRAARIAYRQKDYEGTAGYLIRALKNEPNNAGIQFFFGIVCINLKLPGDAVHALKEAVRLKPDNASYNYALGAAILSAKHSAASIPYFKKYVALRPTDMHGRLALGVAEYEMGDLDSGRRELGHLVTDPTTSAGAHYILGKICRREGDLDCAVKHFTQAIKLDPHDAMLEADISVVYIRQNKLFEAKQAIDRALQLDPENYLANENLLLLMRKQKDPRAEEQAQHFAKLAQKVSEDKLLLLRHIEPVQ